MGLLKGQVAIVTGGGGVGGSIARLLSAEGAAVSVVSLNRDASGKGSADRVVDEIVAQGGQGLALYEDVADAEGAERMVQATIERFGRIDILVLCAGNTTRGLLHELSEEQWDSVIRSHLKGHFLPCRLVVPHMLRQNYGRILMVSSRGAFFQVPNSKRDARALRRPSSTAYSAAKAGILGMTTTLAVELWETGINVNCLLPSATTELFPTTKPRRVGGLPPTESMEPDDVAPAAVYLCSPEAADISGRLMYASGHDIAFYGPQLDAQGARMLRKPGRWTLEELRKAIPGLLGVDE